MPAMETMKGGKFHALAEGHRPGHFTQQGPARPRKQKKA